MSAQQRGYLTVDPDGPARQYNIERIPDWYDWIVCGTVTTAEGTGALVLNKHSDKYCQANNGKLRALPQHKVKAALTAMEPARRNDGSIDEYLA